MGYEDHISMYEREQAEIVALRNAENYKAQVEKTRLEMIAKGDKGHLYFGSKRYL